nr:molybdopterin-guanine dinucleotide biosynthesis protein B [Lachnospiraceae bacterium]
QLRFLYRDCDLIIAEGFKYAPYPKIEFRRAAQGKPRIVADDTLLALVTDVPADPEQEANLPDAPRFSIDDIAGCADLLCRAFGLGVPSA